MSFYTVSTSNSNLPAVIHFSVWSHQHITARCEVSSSLICCQEYLARQAVINFCSLLLAVIYITVKSAVFSALFMYLCPSPTTTVCLYLSKCVDWCTGGTHTHAQRCVVVQWCTQILDTYPLHFEMPGSGCDCLEAAQTCEKEAPKCAWHVRTSRVSQNTPSISPHHVVSHWPPLCLRRHRPVHLKTAAGQHCLLHTYARIPSPVWVYIQHVSSTYTWLHYTRRMNVMRATYSAVVQRSMLGTRYMT